MTATTPTSKTERNRSAKRPPAPKRRPVPREAVERRAYQRYLARGAEHGRDLEDWFLAEEELRREPGEFGRGK
jgi:hypothetical protein